MSVIVFNDELTCSKIVWLGNTPTTMQRTARGASATTSRKETSLKLLYFSLTEPRYTR